MKPFKNIACAIMIVCLASASVSAELSREKTKKLIKPVAKMLAGVSLAAASIFTSYAGHSLLKYEAIRKKTGINMVPFKGIGAISLSGLSAMILGKQLLEKGCKEAHEIMQS